MQKDRADRGVAAGGAGDASGGKEDAGRDSELVSPVAVVPLGIVTAGLYPLWAFLPRFARHARLTGLVPLAEEASAEPPRKAGPSSQEAFVPWVFTVAWLFLATATALGAALPPEVSSMKTGGSGMEPNDLAIAIRNVGILGLLAFPAVVQVYARWRLGGIQRREFAALEPLAGRAGGTPPEVRIPALDRHAGYHLLVLAAIFVPILAYFAATGFEARLFVLVVVYMALIVIFLWAVTLGPVTTAMLFNRHVRACRRAQAWLREELKKRDAAAKAEGRES